MRYNASKPDHGRPPLITMNDDELSAHIAMQTGNEDTLASLLVEIVRLLRRRIS